MNNRSAVIALVAVASLSALLHCAPPRPGPMPFAEEASYVFRGQVVETRSSTVEQLPADAATYAVLVDEVYFQQGNFDDLTGRRITVHAPQAKLESGQRYVFYSEPFLFGSSVAVSLVAATQDERPGSEIAEEVRQAQDRRTLGRRLDEAEAVVVGTVVRVGQREPARRVESEHSPELRQAFLRPDRVLKGDVGAEVIGFFFAASDDVQWYRSPKFGIGDDGIFLLNAGSSEAATLGVGEQQFTLFHPLDFQPPERLQLIEELLKAGGA